jgi:hypothetical protein
LEEAVVKQVELTIRVICTAALFALKPTSAQALPKITDAQGHACYQDAERLCGAPKVWTSVGALEHAKIIACMMVRKAEVSQRCKDAFNGRAPEANAVDLKRRAAPKRRLIELKHAPLNKRKR